MHTTEMTNAKTSTSWFHNRYIHSQNEDDFNLLSRLEIVFLLHSGASLSVLNISTYTMIPQMIKVCNLDQNDTSKTLTIANQSEVPIKHYTSVTCFSSIETTSRYIMIPFVVADFKYFLIGTLFFEKNK